MPLSIIDIPLIVDQIAADLSLRDLKACSQTSRAWNVQFGPHRWRTLWFLDESIAARPDIQQLYDSHGWILLSGINILREPSLYFSASVSSQANTALTTHTAYIRSLFIDILGNASLFLESTQCTRLKELYCFWNRHRDEALKRKLYAHIRAGNDIEMFDGTITPLRLIDKNPGLKKLLVECPGQDLDKFLDWNALASIARSRFLASITLELKGALHQGVLQELMTTIPRTCHTLEIRLRSLHRVEMQTNHTPLVFAPTQHAHASSPSLKSLQLPFKTIVFKGTMYSYEHSTIIPILHHSPDLISLTLPKVYQNAATTITSTLHSRCLNLVVLRMSAVDYEHYSWKDPASLGHLIGGTHSPLQEVSILDACSSRADAILLALTRSAAHSLSVLQLSSTSCYSGELLVKLLMTCSTLRILEIDPPDEPAQYHGVSLEQLGTYPWQSPLLETLHFPIVNSIWKPVVLQGNIGKTRRTNAQESQDSQWLLNLFIKLRRLTKLKHLNLMWFDPLTTPLMATADSYYLTQCMYDFLHGAGMDARSTALLNLKLIR